MLTNDAKQSIFVVTGMHRSGTSLTASLLESAGVDIGKRLLGPDHVNIKGHFENLDFLEFHHEVLYSQGISGAGWTLENQIQVQEQYLDKAKLIVQKNSSSYLWGWKDPRTTLFLNFWADLLPEAKFLLIYRAPWEVVDSLYRRGDDIFNHNPNFTLKIWINYNQTILNFYNQFPGRCILLDIYSISNDINFLLKAIEQKFGILLDNPASDIYDAELLHTQVSDLHRATLIRHCFPEVCKVYQELNQKALQLPGFSNSHPEVPQYSSYEAWVLQDWLDVRMLERQESKAQAQLQQTQAELEQSQAHLQQTQAELEKSRSQLQQTQIELERSQSQLQDSRTELERSQSVLQQTQTEYQRSQSQLNETQIGYQRLQSQLQQTQAEYERSQSQLQQTQVELEYSQSQLRDTQKEKGRSQSQLQDTQTELENLTSQLQQVQTEKERSRLQLCTNQAELAQSQAMISAMESSKFWKLRTVWFKFKQAINLTNTSSPAATSPQTTDSLISSVIPEVNNQEIKFKVAAKNSLSGCFDKLNGSNITKTEVSNVTPVTASGWAILPEAGRPADSVIITHGKKNSFVAVASVDLERLDVVAALDNPAYRKCGWSITLNPSVLPAGKVVLKAWAYNSASNEATQLNFTNPSLQVNHLFSRLKYYHAVFRARGIRYALTKLSKKIYYKLDNSPPPLELLPVASPDDAYARWLNKNFPREADLGKMAETVAIFSYKPVISVIMPVYNPPEDFLREAIESVLHQIYPYWELCIADDASTKPYIKALLEDYTAKDSRIKVVFRTENGHISYASNSALEIATGEFITLLDHDDLLTPDALYEVALLLNKHPDADMIYSDEDKIDQYHQLQEPFFKPDWCPDSFLSRMYTCHLGTYRRSLVTEIGGFRVGYEGSQDYDLVLRLTEKTENIFHIPKILYHWRIHSDSTARSLSSKNYATDAAKKAILDALYRRDEPGEVIPIAGGHHLVRYEVKDSKLISIIIPTKNLGNILDNCLKSIFEKTTYLNYEVLVIDNGSTEIETQDVINKWKLREPNRFRCEVLDIPFNFSKINNYAVEQARGEYLLFLNNDTEVISGDWLEAMVEQAQRPCIGAVGALLLYPDNTIQHAGVVCVGGLAGHSHKHYSSGSPGYFFQVQTINNYLAVTAACLMCRREVFETIGGFEEELSVAFNDIDLCFKMIEKGYRNIYLPHVVLYHYESKSRGYEDNPEKQTRFIKEVKYMQNKWKSFIAYDPCYNPNLTKEREDFSIGL